MNKANITEFFTRLRAKNPEPKSDLEYTNDFTLLVAVVLSAQATDIGVNKATQHLFPIADIPEKMVQLGEDKIRDLIKTIGLYKAKAANVYKLSQILIEKYDGNIPQTREELMALLSSTSPLVTRPLPWTRICSVWATAQVWQKVKLRRKSNANWKRKSRKNSSNMRIIG